MARMPGAIWHPLAADWNKQPRMKAYDFFCIHTMVGTLAGTGTYFEKTNGPGYSGTESHFGVGPDGTIWQFQDTDFQADANGNGNWHVISSENADTGAPFPKWGGSDVPALTPQQVEANARIAAWLNRTHGIPLGIAGSSRPGARGLAAHRYGVPGYMPAGAEQWSSSKGKACPGDRRIAQLPAISARAQQLLGGASGDDDMSMEAERQIAYLYETMTPGAGGVKDAGRGFMDLSSTAHATLDGITNLTATVNTLAGIIAAGRDDVTPEEITAAVDEGIRRGGAAVLAAQEAARAAHPTA